MSKKYEPIPIPFKQWLREIRVRVLPFVVFVGVGIAVAFLWTDKVASPGMIGVVVADSSSVSSPGNGFLANFYAQPFDVVEEGQLLGQIIREDSLLLNAQLNQIRSEIELIRESREPITGEQRARMDLEDLKIEEINTRISLARTQLEQRQAEADYHRTAELWERDLVAEQEYEMARTTYELLNVQVQEFTELAAYLSERIDELEEFTGYRDRADRDPVLAAIKVQEQRMETLLAESAPVPVYASMSGVIRSVNLKRGEYARAGERILQIESRDPSHIVGYMRQPFTIEPQAGMEVQVRTRKPGRAFFNSQIEQLGGHIQVMEGQLQRPGAIFESGLPVKVPITDTGDIQLTPGEIVDIVLR